jgi:hypothetical protein
MKHFFAVIALFFTITTYAQVGIGASNPDASAKLEVRSTNKGLLIPQIALTGSSDVTTIESPATSLLVYNTATTSDVTPGYYYNAGTTTSPNWLRLNTGTSGVPYSGATSAVNLGAYDLTVNEITLGKGAGNISSNTASGYQALFANATGNKNTANGLYALRSNTTGISNTASGADALRFNTTGSDNTANGLYALRSNTTGVGNTASGTSTLRSNTTGNYNTAIGNYAGYDLTTGINNTLIGYDAITSTPNTDNEITLGNMSITSLRCKVSSITSLSDRRDKKDIIPIEEGLAFLKQLNPVSFTWNTRDKAKVGIKSAGFIAQELLALQKQSNLGDNLDLMSENNSEKLEARYGNLLPVIVKAIQEESAEKDKEIKALKERLDALEKQIKQMLNK